MLEENLLYLYKARMLRIIGQYGGIQQRTDQLITDAQININMNVRPADVRQALAALKDDGFIARQLHDLRGEVWRITPAGHIQCAKMALESDDA